MLRRVDDVLAVPLAPAVPLASMLGYTLSEIDVAGAQPEAEPRRPPSRLRRHSCA